MQSRRNSRRLLFKQVTIIGLGLIGGSLGMALRKRRLAGKIFGVTRKPSHLRQALAAGAAGEGSTRWNSQAAACDLVVIATPPETVVKIAREVARNTRGSFLMIDVASTKGGIVRALGRTLPRRISFIGCHPMAGSERSGIQAADPRLFEGAACILTRDPRTNRQALRRVSHLWQTLGARVAVLSPRQHDALVAEVSHLPHLAAAGLVLSASSAALRLAGNGFADTTRVALGNPALWRQICLENQSQIIRSLDRFLAQTKKLRALIGSGQGQAFYRQLRQAQLKRRKVRR